MTCSRVPRPVQQDAHPHEGTIVTDRIDDVWDEPLSGRQWLRSPIVAPSVRARWATVRATAGDGPRTMANDMTQTVTTGEGRAFGLSLDWVAFDASLFIAVDHCSGEFIGTHASSSASRWEALEPVRQGVTQPFGGVGPDVAKGLTLRHDHGSNYMADDFRREIGCFGILSSPAFVRQPEGNGVAERAIRTLKEQLIWVRHFETVEELRQALAAFAAEHNASWLRQRHRYKHPIRSGLSKKPLNPKPPRGLKWLHNQRRAPSQSRAPVQEHPRWETP